MGSMILCRTKTAKRPYRVNGIGIRIYSLEELCYYIYNNVYLLGNDFIDENLIEFIGEEIGEKQLSDRLELLLKQKAGLAELMVTILKYVDYYTINEIENIKGVLETLSTQNVLERLKARADSFLENQCYNSAIDNYIKILESPVDTSLSAMFYAKVNHNIGVAYTQLFLYKQAVAYFDEAYKIGWNEESKKCSAAAARMALGENIIERDDTTEEEYVLKREIETLMDNARYSDEYRQLADMEKIKEDGQVTEYYEKITEILESWKNQYIKYIS
ncbi:MAG: hypothetical protein IJB96_09475 [Lachnospira sp.]|nr:hypothetical protein [Lachnospira sp.]